MAQQDRDVLIVVDGGWEQLWIDNAILGYEHLRLIRWMLRVDFYLPVIGKHLQFDWRIAHEIVNDPAKVADSKGLVGLNDMQTACDAAESFYARCIAEQIYRGDAEPADEDARQWATGVVEKLKARQSEDFVLGVKLVSEASGEDLHWATLLSRRRVDFLRAMMAAMTAGAPPAPPYAFQG